MHVVLKDYSIYFRRTVTYHALISERGYVKSLTHFSKLFYVDEKVFNDIVWKGECMGVRVNEKLLNSFNKKYFQFPSFFMGSKLSLLLLDNK